MNRQNIKLDSALGLTIPESMANQTGIKPNSEVLLRKVGKTIVISSPTSENALDKLLSQVTEENRHGETDTGHHRPSVAAPP